MILELQRALKDDGVIVSLVKLCAWFSVPRRTVYYKPTKGDPKVQAKFVEPIKAMIEENSAFGYRTVAHLLDMIEPPRVSRRLIGLSCHSSWATCPVS
jgi:putative transposase